MKMQQAEGRRQKGHRRFSVVGVICAAGYSKGLPRRGGECTKVAIVDSLAPARSALAGLCLRSDRRWAPSLPFSRPCGLRYSQFLFATSQVAQIPSGSSAEVTIQIRNAARVSQVSQVKNHIRLGIKTKEITHITRFACEFFENPLIRFSSSTKVPIVPLISVTRQGAVGVGGKQGYDSYDSCRSFNRRFYEGPARSNCVRPRPTASNQVRPGPSAGNRPIGRSELQYQAAVFTRLRRAKGQSAIGKGAAAI